MSLGGDDRGQSVVIGAVILFGFLVIAMSTYQATVVPAQNSQAEFGHEQAVRNDLVGVRDAVVTAGTTGATAPASVKLGTRFPDRTLFVNPPPAVGRLETRPGENVTLNVSRAQFGTDAPGEAHETREGWPTAAAADGNYTTKTLVYTPQYRAYDGGPANVTLESTHVLARYTDGTAVNLTQSPLLVSGDRVTLFLLRGNLSEAGVDEVTVEPSAVSPVGDRVRVSNFNVTVPTTLSPAGYEAVLTRGSRIDDGDVIVTANTSRRAVDVRFPGSYSLGVAAVSVGRHREQRRAAAVDFVSVERNVTQGESARVVVRVRDQYGNPLPGATVVANATGVGNESQSTDGSGRTAFQFDTDGTSGSVDVNVTVNRSGFDVEERLGSPGFDQSTAENATANVTVESGGPTGPSPSPPSSPSDVVVSWNTSEMTATTGVRYFSGNQTLVVNRSEVGDRFTALANATNATDGSGISGVQLDFASGNASIVDFGVSGSNEPGPTDVNGELSSPAGVSVNGSTNISLFGASTSATLRVKTVGADLSPAPPSGEAYADSNQNGLYDPGEETYRKSELNDFDKNVHLVIPGTVGTVNSGGNPLRIEAKSVTSRVSLETGGGQLTVTATQGSVEFTDGTTVDSGGSKLEMRATGQIRIDEVTLDSGGDTITLDGTGVYGEDATLDSGGSRLSVDAGSSDLRFTRAQLNSNGGRVDLDTDAELRLEDASVDSNGAKTTLIADDVFAEGFESTGGGEFSVDATGRVDVTGATIRTNGNSFTLTAGGAVLADDIVVGTNGSPLRVEAENGDDVRVRGGRFDTNGAVFDVITDGGNVCLNRSPDTGSPTEIRTNGERATITDAAATYLNNLFVSSSGGGLRYSGGPGVKGDYYGDPAASGDGVNSGDWQRQGSGNGPCGP